jgi:hypothetical protein
MGSIARHRQYVKFRRVRHPAGGSFNCDIVTIANGKMTEWRLLACQQTDSAVDINMYRVLR